MNGYLALITRIPREQQYSHANRRARLAAAVRACCSPSRLERLTRAVRRTLTTA